MIPAESLERARAVPIEDVAERFGLKLLRGKVERVGPCPICGGRDRFSINIKKQVWNCRGCDRGGDVIALAQFLERRTFADAVEVLAGNAPSSSRKPVASGTTRNSVDDYERMQRGKARALFRSSRPTPGTPVESYLRSRGIMVSSPAIRYLPARTPDQRPAMLVPYGLPDEVEPGDIEISADQIHAVQLTFLRPDGAGKADVKPNKITIASPGGMPMVIAPMNDLLGLAVTEGVEDALSVHQATGLGAWASGGAGFMPKLTTAVEDLAGREYDASPECVTIFGHEDEDGQGQRGARDLADALLARGIEVFMEGLS